MSRKRKAPVRKIYPDPKYRSVVISKFINSIMYDGKRSTAEKILYDALDKIKQKGKEERRRKRKGPSSATATAAASWSDGHGFRRE